MRNRNGRARKPGFARVFLAAALTLGGVPAATALINPQFTPIHLTTEAAFIAVLSPAMRGDPQATVTFPVAETLKGEAIKEVRFDLSGTDPDQRKAVQETLAKARQDQGLILFFSGKSERGDAVAYLNLDGRWIELDVAGDGRWNVARVASDMLATWNGGPDMLLRCLRYILANPDTADVPSVEGMGWRSMVKVGRATGTPVALATPDLAGDGTTFLHVACPEGDMLWQGARGREGATDVTARMKLAARSQAAVWGCFFGNARPELLSHDGRNLTLFSLGKDGCFSAAEVQAAVPTGIVNMLAVDLDLPGKPGVALMTGNGLTVLRADAKGGFTAAYAREIPADMRKPLGHPSKAVAADFDGDSLVDILQPFEKGGLLYAGAKDGTFAAPRPCMVATREGPARAGIGDFDNDRALDVLLAGQSGVSIYQNDGKGQFTETLRLCGEVSYKAPPNSSWCDAGDFNNDGRPDFILLYDAQLPIFYFNRGFRSFGLAVGLYTTVQAEENLQAMAGQKGGILADLDADGAQDVVMVMANSEIWCLYNSLGGENNPANIRVQAPVSLCGPVSVEYTNAVRSLGRQVVQAGVREACFGIVDNERGPATLTWQLPGQARRNKMLQVEDKTIIVPLGAEK